MGIFDGILIASDWDGTLFCDETVPERTRKAVNYFMSEGGRFAITSGRAPYYLIEQSHFIKPNTYCICFGGSLICDIESGDVLRRGSVGEGVFEVVDRILASKIEIVRINVFRDELIKHYTPRGIFRFRQKRGYGIP